MTTTSNHHTTSTFGFEGSPPRPSRDSARARWRRTALGAAALVALGGCSPTATLAESSIAPAASTIPETATPTTAVAAVPPKPTTAAATITPATTITQATSAATSPDTSAATSRPVVHSQGTLPATTVADNPIPSVPDRTATYDFTEERLTIGTSVQGRPIVAERYGTLGGRRVLVLGVIHGDEDAGVQIVEKLRISTVPDGVELWIVESMNPDGQAAQIRHNSHGVDLNRNFPYGWEAMAPPGDWQYPGPAAASEPETRAMVNFVAQLKPDIAISYHQDLFVISEGKGRAEHIRARYAELSGIPLEPTFSTPGAKYTGIAMSWINHDLGAQDAVAFVVELGPTLSDDDAGRNANAVLTVAAEG